MTTTQRLEQHDKQIAAIRKLVMTGMKMLVRNQQQLNQLAVAQKKTEASLKALIDDMRGSGGNGHNKRKLDL